MTTTDALSGLPCSGDFPAKGDVEDMVRFCLGYAILAPSSHNAQPWWFQVDDNVVTIGLDVSRGLAVVDPRDRQGIMSVGAVLLTLRVALARFGLACRINRWPDPLDPEACVRVVASLGEPVEDDLINLFEAIEARRTSREAFEDRPVAHNILDSIAADIAVEGALATVFTQEDERAALAVLVSRADQEQMSDPRFRRELATWLRRSSSRRRDGLHSSSPHSPLDQVLAASPIVVRTFDSGHRRGARDRELISGSPAMMVVSTLADEPDAWLRVGQAMARAMLRATTAGLSVGFLNQAVEVAATRAELTDLLGGGVFPQLLMRIGFGPVVDPQPRRPLDAFIAD